MFIHLLPNMVTLSFYNSLNTPSPLWGGKGGTLSAYSVRWRHSLYGISRVTLWQAHACITAGVTTQWLPDSPVHMHVFKLPYTFSVSLWRNSSPYHHRRDFFGTRPSYCPRSPSLHTRSFGSFARCSSSNSFLSQKMSVGSEPDLIQFSEPWKLPSPALLLPKDTFSALLCKLQGLSLAPEIECHIPANN